MSVHLPTTEARADLELRVPRGEAGSLDEGARSVLEKVDAVRRVEVERIGGMRPDAFDLYVEVTADLELELPDGADPAETLGDGFGVVGVERCEER
ncbi:hypothetical protein [Halosegnis marinus]|uniref:Uncharacterized protein n=1 Tax=Halosegnis marinus TaxID=3034023 RepID=A0ABD5ZRR7_9EURY|nr:hypothetical protein [Halosegnis sp. DT85]